MILAIDTGTTRTRVWMLTEDGDPIEAASGLAGARDLAGRHDREWLAEQLQQVTEDALDSLGIGWGEIEAVVGFGMITSELGLIEVPHLPAPVAWPELAAAMARWETPLLPVPLFLVPGVRTEADRVEGTDVMRGEETEIVGLLSLDQLSPPFLYVSPGSHSKFAWIDESARIAWSLTTLSGELLWALHRETILAELVDLDAATLGVTRVEEGARFADTHGLTRTLFVARLANRLQQLPPSECSSLLHGAVAGTDLRALERRLPQQMPPVPVALLSDSTLGEAYRQLLESRAWVQEIHIIEQPLGAIGARALYEAGAGASEKGRPLRA